MSVRRIIFVLTLLAVAAPLWADEVIFKNGDKITGTIVSADGAKLMLNSKVAGTITIDMTQVQTFSTDAPIEVKLNDGTVLHEKFQAAAPGTVAVAPGGTIQPQAVALDKVKAVNPPPVKWAGALTAGAMLTRGNSDTRSWNFALDLVRRSEIDRITVDAGYNYGSQKDLATGQKTTTTDNWFLATQYDYFVNPKWYIYANNRIEKDRIAALNLRLTPGVGVGYQWLDRADLKFNTEGGLSWVYENFSNDGTNQKVSLRFAYHLMDQLNDKVVLLHNTEYYPKLDTLSDYFVTTDAALRATLTPTMFSEIKAVWNHDAKPAPGAKKDDVRLMLNVGWTL